MNLSSNPVQNAHDHAMITRWAQAVGVAPGRVFVARAESILHYSDDNQVRFVCEYSPMGHLLHTERLEHLRQALIHECLSNLLDVAIFIDDDAEESLALYRRLISGSTIDNVPVWLAVPTDSITLRTIDLGGK